MAPSRSPEERMLTAGIMFSLADTDPAAHPDLLARAMCVVSLSLSSPLFPANTSSQRESPASG